eukprot:FR737844.1.p1 GENE.FR737844.1~~FR737844.1.p1  ORF type:complete len:233 (+),score=20.09 FR737844.1:3-701(+)
MSTDDVAQWCASSRVALLKEHHVQGDLPLGNLFEHCSDVATGEHWTLERLWLAECPPRFPRLYFDFASDVLNAQGHTRLQAAVDILIRHPGLQVRILGYGHPTVPPQYGSSIAQARAARTRKLMLERLRAQAPGGCWDTEPDEDGVHELGYTEILEQIEEVEQGIGFPAIEFYRPRLIGRHIQALGAWDPRPSDRNANFVPREDDGFDIDEEDDPEAKYRRVDFTIVGLLPC